jgi:hypothetical protein
MSERAIIHHGGKKYEVDPTVFARYWLMSDGEVRVGGGDYSKAGGIGLREVRRELVVGGLRIRMMDGKPRQLHEGEWGMAPDANPGLVTLVFIRRGVSFHQAVPIEILGPETEGERC